MRERDRPAGRAGGSNWEARVSLVLSTLALAVSVFFALPQAAQDYGWVQPPWTVQRLQGTKEDFVRSILVSNEFGATRAETYAAPASPALRYARSRVLLLETYNALASEEEVRELAERKVSATSTTGGKVRGCIGGGCVTFDDFLFTDDEKIRSFSINGSSSDDFIVNSTSNYAEGGVTVELLSGVRSRNSKVLNVGVQLQNFDERAVVIDKIELLDQNRGDTSRLEPRGKLFERRARPFQAISGYLTFATPSNRGWIGITFRRQGQDRLQTAWLKFDPY